MKRIVERPGFNFNGMLFQAAVIPEVPAKS